MEILRILLENLSVLGEILSVSAKQWGFRKNTPILGPVASFFAPHGGSLLKRAILSWKAESFSQLDSDGARGAPRSLIYLYKTILLTNNQYEFNKSVRIGYV